jgi:copper(I)-binding protein
MTDQSPSRRVAGRAASGGLLALALLLGTAAAGAPEYGITLTGGWMRFLISQRPAAGYFTLHNSGADEKVLVTADSPACQSLMLHRSMSQGGMESMMMVEQVPIPAHGSLAFAPGGYHLMCMHPSIHPGDTAHVTLHFADGGTLAADLAVRGATGQ